MAFRSLGGTRISVLGCDSCDSIMARDGTTGSLKFADSDPTQLAPHYESPGELRALAGGAGWIDDSGRWSCPGCVRKSSNPGP
jgi:hypothetical protein